MTESIARAERLDLQSSSSPTYLWEVPQKPVSVRFPFPLIDRLEHEAVESFRSLTSRGSEIGGLLLGSVVPGTPALVTIEDFELIACDYSRGPLYRLSDADMGRFDQAIERHGARLAGYFRSHTRKGLSLDADDLAFFLARFGAPHHIALLIRPFAAKASTGGIFIREGGVVRGEASYLEFPLRSSELTAARPAAEQGNGRGAAPPAPAAAKPAVRAQIVPIAPRREGAAPAPVEPAVTPAAVPVTAAAPQPAPAKPAPAAASAPAKPAPAPVPAKPAAAAAPVKPVPPAAPVPAKPAQAAAPAKFAPPAAPARGAEKAPVAAPPREKARPAAPVTANQDKTAPAADLLDAAEKPQGYKLWMVGSAAAGLLLIVLLFVYPGFLRKGNRIPTAAQKDSSALALHVERTTGGLLLTWNRDSEAIKNATRAVLSISDGERHENSNMDLNLLRSGSIVYSPVTGNVSFLMEVTGRDKSKVTTDALQFLDSRPSPVADGTQPAANPGGPANPQLDPAKAANAPAADAANAQEAKPVSVTPSKPFNKDSLSQRLRPARPEDLPEAPAMGQSADSATPAALGAIAPPPVMQASPPASAPAQPPAAVPPAPKQAVLAKTGGKFEEAVVISRKEPEFPKLARQSGATGAVVLAATIGADGKVKTVKVVSGNAMLRQAAINAVMQWKYKPALLNGVQVDSPATITINFTGGR